MNPDRFYQTQIRIFAIISMASLLFLACNPKESDRSDRKRGMNDELLGNPVVKVKHSDEKGIEFYIITPQMKLIDVTSTFGVFQRINPLHIHQNLLLDGDEYFSQPEIPVVTVHLALPFDAKPGKVDIRGLGDERWQKGVRLYPVQKEQYTSSEEPVEFPFEFDEKLYLSGERNVNNVLNYRKVGGQNENIYKLSIPAMSYSPANQVLSRFDTLLVSIQFGMDNPCFKKKFPAKAGEFTADLVTLHYRQMTSSLVASIINPDVLKNPCEWVFKPLVLGCELLIITDPDFQDAASDLRAHKNARGISTHVVNTQKISDDFGDGSGNVTDVEVKAWIDDFYSRAWNKPKWLLILGDAEHIPPHYTTTVSNNAHCAGDQFYGQLSNIDMEIPWFGIGRFPVDDLVTAQSIVNRVKAYETNRPGYFNGFHQDLTFAAQFQDDEPDSTANRWFAETSEDIRNYLLTQHMDVERIYRIKDTTIVPTYWKDGTEIPADLQKPTFAWDGSTSDITEAITRGTIILYHRDHGSRSGWGTPSFKSGDLGSFTISNNEYPLVFSINCASGVYDNETVNLPANLGTESGMSVNVGSSYWAEKFLRQEHGAIGIIGDTRNSSTARNNEMAKGLFDAMWPDYQSYGGATPIRTLGDVLNHAKGYVDAGGAGDAAVFKENTIYNLLGDPSLSVNPHRIWKPIIFTLIPEFSKKLIRVEYKLEIPECPKCPPVPDFLREPPYPIVVLQDPRSGEIISRTMGNQKGIVEIPFNDYRGTALVNISGEGVEFQSKRIDLR
ncbi:MAG: hypothetical protein K9I85_09885 [Saprospiraceae bacterium]|nr:hypothetical protein [Saprospiraceae bacterium]